MPYDLECAQSFHFGDATERDIHHAFDNDAERGEYIILTAPDGSFMQAAGEGKGPYVVEHRDGRSGGHFVAQGEFSKEEVRTAFLQYLRGDESWRAGNDWRPLEEVETEGAGRGGCATVIAAVMLVGVIAALTL